MNPTHTKEDIENFMDSLRENVGIVEHGIGHRAVKRIVAGVAQLPKSEIGWHFLTSLSAVAQANLESWISSRAAFILVVLCEQTSHPKCAEGLLNELRKTKIVKYVLLFG